MKQQWIAIVIGAGLAAGCAGHASGSATVTTSSTEVYQEPPAPEAEHPTIERPGYFWIQGRWEWRANQWNWLGGHWEKERADQEWHVGHWDKRGNAWHWSEGQWAPKA